MVRILRVSGVSADRGEDAGYGEVAKQPSGYGWSYGVAHSLAPPV
jgi:hypothetical protein